MEVSQIRLFLAFPLSLKIKNAIFNIETQFIKSNLNAKFVEKENLHLTIKFIGNFPENKLEKLIAYIAFITRKMKKTNIILNKVGYFSYKHFPSVLWIGTNKNYPIFSDLYKDFNIKLNRKFNIKSERKKFFFHCTLARIRKTDDIQKQLIDNQIEKLLPFSLAIPITNLVLYKSTLTPNGSKYAHIHSFEFK